MIRTLISVLAALFCLMPAMAPGADDRSEYDWMRHRLTTIEIQIAERTALLRSEIAKGFAADVKEGRLDLQKVNQLLQGKFGHPQLNDLLTELKFSTELTVPVAKEKRDQYEAIRRPLDVADAEIAAAELEYDNLLDRGWDLDLWGIGGFEPKGTYGPELRDKFHKLRELYEKRKALKEQIDAQVRANPEWHHKNLEELERAVTRSYDTYRGQTVPAALTVKRLIAEIAKLIDERTRLEEFLTSGSLIVVWYNDVGWVHVGTREQFEREKFRARGSEIWGGRGQEKLQNTLILNPQGYTTLQDAVKAVLESAGSIERRGAPLAFPKVYYVGNVAGAERKIGFEIVEHPLIQAHLKSKP